MTIAHFSVFLFCSFANVSYFYVCIKIERLDDAIVGRQKRILFSLARRKASPERRALSAHSQLGRIIYCQQYHNVTFFFRHRTIVSLRFIRFGRIDVFMTRWYVAFNWRRDASIVCDANSQPKLINTHAKCESNKI